MLWLRQRLLLRHRPQQARQSLLATFQNTSSVITASRQADGNTFVSQIVQVVYAGDFAGSVVEHIDLVIHPDGTLNAKGADLCTRTLTGTGLLGAIALPFSATGDTSGSVSGRFTFADGTGGLANLHGDRNVRILERFERVVLRRLPPRSVTLPTLVP